MKYYINALTPFCEERDKLNDAKRDLCRNLKGGDYVGAQLSLIEIVTEEIKLIAHGKLNPEDMTV